MTQETLEIAEDNRDEFLTLLFIYGKETWWEEIIRFAKNEELDNFVELWVKLFLNKQNHFICQEELCEIWNFYRGPFRNDEYSTKMIEPSMDFMKISYDDFETLIDEKIEKKNNTGNNV